MNLSFVSGVLRQISGCYSEGKIDDDETVIRVRYGRTNDCRPCTSPPDFVGKTIDELLSSDLLCDASELILITTRLGRCGKVIFSVVSVCHYRPQQ